MAKNKIRKRRRKLKQNNIAIPGKQRKWVLFSNFNHRSGNYEPDALRSFLQDINCDQYRVLSHRTRALMRRDKERYVRGLSEDVKCHLILMTSDPPYQALKKLGSKFTSEVSAIGTADDCFVSNVSDAD